jgi:uncharacterized delta-60 repeat protein
MVTYGISVQPQNNKIPAGGETDAMKKKSDKQPLVRIIRGVVPTAIASGLLSPVTMGAPGDLDPSFGNMGRLDPGLPFGGPAWSVQPLSADESLFAGGYCDYYCSYYHEADVGFIGQLSDSGVLESQFSATPLQQTEIRDVALQPDGKIIAVGRQRVDTNNVFTVLRLKPDGTLDTSFANQGVLNQTSSDYALSVTLDPSGAIAVAGASHGNLIVIRLLANGTPDASFGDAGTFLGPPGNSTNILRTTGGGYRVSTNYYDTTSKCTVVGLTSAGKIDNSFGTAGIAPAPGASVTCASMVSQSDGALLLGGTQDGHGFAVRLLAGGAQDATFVASQVPVAMQMATALAVDAAGNVLIAGTAPAGVPGALVVRLQASGALDPAFGNAGSAWIDLGSNAAPIVHDMAVLADGRVLAAGGGSSAQTPAFVARLLGDAGTPGAGVVGFAPSSLTVKEKDQKATVTVRRTGGAAGAVSVAYHTGDYTGSDAPTATAGQDYTAVSGQLSWSDGDRTDKQITVPVAADAGPPELSERFVITLDTAAGGVALGTSQGVVEILGDGDPTGQFDLEVTTQAVDETAGNLAVVVDRNYYSAGATSVTVTPVAGSATSADISITPIILSWADGDTAPKTATIAITPGTSTSTKSFKVQLSNATNGAVIGPQSVQTVTITYPPPPPPPPPSGGGGGGVDWLTLAGLGLLRWLGRRAR